MSNNEWMKQIMFEVIKRKMKQINKSNTWNNNNNNNNNSKGNGNNNKKDAKKLRKIHSTSMISLLAINNNNNLVPNSGRTKVKISYDSQDSFNTSSDTRWAIIIIIIDDFVSIVFIYFCLLITLLYNNRWLLFELCSFFIFFYCQIKLIDRSIDFYQKILIYNFQ